MATTTNYGWTTPDDTALVKDGASAIRSLGTSVDTTTKNLNPSTTLGDIEYRSSTANTNTRLGIGTTGQVLTVAGGVPTWATSDDANAIQNAIVDAKGDLISATAADTPARLAVGANGTVLTADSAEATGLKWAAPAGGGKVLQVVSATTTTQKDTSSGSYSDSNLTATITPTLSTSKILVLANQSGLRRSVGSASNALSIRLVRGATALMTRDLTLWTNTTLLQTIGSDSFMYLDSPATTSATTYKTQIASYNATSDVGVQYNDNMSSIILLEIGA
jgi:hypothetical protein